MTRHFRIIVLLALAWAVTASALVTSVAWANTGLDDGDYLVDVTLEGGSGRASIHSPTELTVKDGNAVVTITWSSPNYDYMIVADEKFHPVNTEGNSEFKIPVSTLNEPLEVIADTTAMSVPHEIEYQLKFDPDTVSIVEEEPSYIVPIASAIMIAIVIWLAPRRLYADAAEDDPRNKRRARRAARKQRRAERARKNKGSGQTSGSTPKRGQHSK